MPKSSYPPQTSRKRRISRETKRELWVGFVTSVFAVVAMALVWWFSATE